MQGERARQTGSERFLSLFCKLEDATRYAARRAELRRKVREAARVRARQASTSSQNEAEESDEADRGRRGKEKY